MSKQQQTYKDWELFKINLLKSTTVLQEDETTKQKRIAYLKSNYEDFFRYYFPNYYTSEPAFFHKKASKRYIENDTIYEVRAWSRELAKSARSMMENIYLALTGKIRNVILISNSQDAAEKLLKPYLLNFEYNQRIIADYGEQKGMQSWESNNFVTRSGCAFSCFGAGQSPRGTRNEEIRPDVLIFDDIDTDEEVRNNDRIIKKWNWIEQAVIPTVSVSKSKRIIFLGNIIGKDTCITRAMERADFCEVINIRDKNGVSTWKEKNTEAHIDWLLSKISYSSGQKEYFNNPITEGTVFKQINWGKVPAMSEFKILVIYGDPSYSNKTNKKNSHKCAALIGEYQNTFYIIDCRLGKATNSEFAKWYWSLQATIKENIQVYNYVENNSLQDPYFSQVIKPEFELRSNIESKLIQPMADSRKKPEKYARIEGNLEPLNRDGMIIFNEKQKDNPNMKLLAEQFLIFSENNLTDGPDAVEGGIWILQNKLRKSKQIFIKSSVKQNNKYK